MPVAQSIHARINPQYGWEEKLCPKCGEWWPKDPEFFPVITSNGKDYLHSYCRACYYEYNNKRRNGKC